ncbi:hypothetical protein A3D83_01430 [Candidatus Daviesbacteria bacterium RIFCSPHIGHO2_02_FULL_41_10]|uniref:Uncharacterized protein n=2 Tax=Candidatus Daviesiibacteriota TaxID=1752718 RepID=A0A1F5ISX7_9BACT|nr:MAG: hypothetical protein A2871_01065 [Candidatus Daviesbacteria bacterium RIFCSPHIGHO2_01_FULL_41_23]OGE32633.1 MAG: hypothetical protein A3D83_01430 [Candidatus Daviesbacteria bacterium RIFCSPHIGHO2_02_FULL_41_10]OGE62485.1 MAG: hypothetical protein A2967_01550 [Candidatus Daviesbacteria bacterium RIFCSPLOWO2_01_FULL_41_32]
MKTETKHQILNLEDLQTFQQSGVSLGPKLGKELENTQNHIICFVRQKEFAAASVYRKIIGRTPDNFSVLTCDNPVKRACNVNEKQVIPLVINSAINPNLKDIMFGSHNFGELLADRFPFSNTQDRKTTPILHCVGITKHGIEILAQKENTPDQIFTSKNLEEERSARLRKTLGNIVTPTDFRNILRSLLVKEINLHALGPAGTNISQAAHLYIEKVRISNKTSILIHGSGITPLEYAQMAKEQTEKSLLTETLPETLHLHMECAVFDGMGSLYQQRAAESIFIDEQNMALDSMQLSAQLSIDKLRTIAKEKGKIRIATHPSPRSLVLPWINQGMAEWLEASSNSVAAVMVIENQADACVTTGSAVTLLAEQNLHTLHQFGSPNMIFTIASPLSHSMLQKYLDKEGCNI